MEELKQIKEILVDQVQSQMHNLHGVNAKELGEVIDMIKDLSETMYYCSIVQAMEEGQYQESPYLQDDRSLFYGGGMNRGYSSASNGGNGSSTSSRGNNARGYHDGSNGSIFRNYEGRSGMSRRMYMEGKENGQDSSTQIQELENYMQELTQDIAEMIQGASQEEKQMLQRKVNALAAKLQNV